MPGFGVGGARDEFYSWRGKTRRGQQRALDIGVQTADPGPHQIRECARQRYVSTRHLTVERPCKLDGIKRISPRNLVDPHRRRPREGAPKLFRYDRVQITDT